MAGAEADGLLKTGGGQRTGGALLQAARLPTMRHSHTHRTPTMTLLLLEALGAGLIFVAIIWWTMFAGRKNGELEAPEDDKAPK